MFPLRRILYTVLAVSLVYSAYCGTDQAPSASAADLTFSTATRRPKMIGVTQLTPPQDGVVTYYRVLEFTGERHYATAPIAGIQGICPPISGSESITPVNLRKQVTGRVTYIYSQANDGVIVDNGTHFMQGQTNDPAWPANVCSPPDSPLPLGIGFTSDQPVSLDWTVAPNNPLSLHVVGSTLAEDNQQTNYLDYIGDGNHYYPNWSSNKFRMVLREEDLPPDAEARAKITLVADESNAAARTSIRGTRTNGVVWTIREVNVKVRFKAQCAGIYKILPTLRKGVWHEGQPTAFGEPYADQPVTVSLRADELHEHTYIIPQVIGEEVMLDSLLVQKVVECSSCTDGGGQAGSGTGPTNGSIYWYLPLGKVADGRSAGGFILHQNQITAQIYTPILLEPALVEGAGVIVKDAVGRVRQVLVPEALADIVVTSALGYEVRFYERADAGTPGNDGMYMPSGSPYLVWKVENPDSSGLTANRLKVTKTVGSESLVTEVDESVTGKRVFTEGSGQRVTETVQTSEGSARVETIVTKNSAGVVSSKKKVYFEAFAWGEERTKEVLDPDGAALTTEWSFETSSASPAYRQLKTFKRPDGFVETFQYDDSGRETLHQSPAWDNTEQKLRTTKQFADLNGDGVADELTKILNSVSLSTLGLKYIVDWGRTSLPYKKRDVYDAAIGSATWNSPENRVTHERYSYDGKLIYRLSPGGMLTLRSVSEIAGGTTTVVTRQGEADATSETVVDGTITTEVYSNKGVLLSTVVKDIATDLVLSSVVTEEVDGVGNPTQLRHLDGALELREYCASCGQMTQRSLRGESTSWLLDSLGRKVEETYRAGSTILSKKRYQYDADGRMTGIRRVDPGSGAETVLISTEYDLAGRITSEFALGNGTTSHTYAFDTEHCTTETTTFADGSTRIEKRGASGATLRVRGTSVAPIDFGYATLVWTGTGDGYFYDIKRPNDDGSNQTERQYINAYGELDYSEIAGNARTSMKYDNAGRLISVTDPDGVKKLFSYDARGRQAVAAIDMNGNGTIDFAGSDRISRTRYEVGLRGAVTVSRTISEVWETTGQDAPTTDSVSEVSADGLHLWQTVRGQTSTRDMLYDGVGKRTDTSTRSDGVVRLESYLGSRLLSTIIRGSSGTQVSAIENGYDSIGRLTSITDARNGVSTLNYDSSDRLSSMVSADPNPTGTGVGNDPQTTSYEYDAMGHVVTTTLPDGGIANTSYYPMGQVKRSWGTRTVPVEYTYDIQNRLKTLTTWKDFAGNTGRAVTTWNYDNARGWLVNKKYQDNTGPSYSYSSGGRASGRVWARTPAVSASYSYNAAGDLASTDYSDTTPDVTITYDRTGRMKTVVDASGSRSIAYDDSGSPTDETYTAGILNGVAVNRTYDSNHRLASVAVSKGATLSSTSYAYDEASRLQDVTTGLSKVRYSYATNSSLVNSLVFTQNGTTRLTTTRNYDLLNRSVGVMNQPGAEAASVGHQYAYNNANQRTRATREDDSYWNYTYDSLGQVTGGSKFQSDGSPRLGFGFAWTYDDIGNRKTAVVNGQTETYNSSGVNAYTQVTVPGAIDLLGAAAAGAIVTVTTPPQSSLPTPVSRQGELFYKQISVDNTAFTVQQQVDILGVKNFVGSNGEDALALATRHALVPKTPQVFTYDADGNLKSDARWSYMWDAENRLTGQTATLEAIRTEGAPRQLDYKYDAQGRRVEKRVTTPGLIGLSVRAAYYDLSELEGPIVGAQEFGSLDFWAPGTWHPSRSTPVRGYSVRWDGTLRAPTTGTWTLTLEQSDAHGYRLWLDGALLLNRWPEGSNGTAQSVNVTLEVGRDYAIRVDYSEPPLGWWKYGYAGLKWSGPGVAQQLIPASRGLAAASDDTVKTTRYIYDGWNLLAEIDGAGTSVCSYTWGLDMSGSLQGAGGVGGLLAMTPSSPAETHFTSYDGNGNLVAMVSATTGTSSAKYEYNAFGKTLVSEGPIAPMNPFRFSTKYADAETTQIYYGLRYYAPATGRWPSRDPIEEQGGVNLYGFVSNNPINRIDPLGLWSPLAHDYLLEFAFRTRKEVSEEKLKIMQASSRAFDIETATDDKASNMHSMRMYGQTQNQARRARDAWVWNLVKEARKLRKECKEKEAHELLGKAFHTLMDSTSPEHVDDNGNLKLWYSQYINGPGHSPGPEATPWYLKIVGYHGDENPRDITVEIYDRNKGLMNRYYDLYLQD